jgi:hypothetical protein
MGCRRREALIRGERWGAWEGWTRGKKVSAAKQNLKEDVNPAAARPGAEFITLECCFRFIGES